MSYCSVVPRWLARPVIDAQGTPEDLDVATISELIDGEVSETQEENAGEGWRCEVSFEVRRTGDIMGCWSRGTFCSPALVASRQWL